MFAKHGGQPQLSKLTTIQKDVVFQGFFRELVLNIMTKLAFEPTISSQYLTVCEVDILLVVQYDRLLEREWASLHRFCR